MNELGDWMQIHWFELASLLVQIAFLTAALWFARKILKTMRASQEQVGALLKLALSDAMGDPLRSGATTHRSTSSVAGERPSPYVMAEWPTATEAPALTLPEGEHRSRRLAAARRGLVQWLQTPMSSPGLVSWRRVTHWLQAPAGS